MYAAQWAKRFCCGCCSKKRTLQKNVDFVQQIKAPLPKESHRGLPTIEEAKEDDEITMQYTGKRGELDDMILGSSSRTLGLNRPSAQGLIMKKNQTTPSFVSLNRPSV